ILNFWCLSFLQTYVIREADIDEESSGNSNGKRQLKLSNFGVTTSKKKKEDVESSGKGRCKFFETRKLEQLADF
ncbi:hypothetical protein LINPERPRIM_LOCUS9875, partial [Linum perenne]